LLFLKRTNTCLFGSSPFFDITVSGETHYWYKVSASNNIGESNASVADEGWATIPDENAPGQPIDLAATDDQPGFIDITWTAGANTDYYALYRNGEFRSLVNTTSFTDNDVLSWNTYDYFVFGINENGYSLPSNIDTGSSIPNIGTPGIPTNFKASDDARNAIYLSWAFAPGYVHHYNIYRDYTVIAGVYGDESTFVDRNIENGVVYTYYVTSDNKVEAIFDYYDQTKTARCSSLKETIEQHNEEIIAKHNGE